MTHTLRGKNPKQTTKNPTASKKVNQTFDSKKDKITIVIRTISGDSN